MDARIILKDQDPGNSKYYIRCSEVPPPGGVGRIVIENVSRTFKVDPAGKEYEELRIPSTIVEEQVPAEPGMELQISLLALLDGPGVDRIVIPYNGGVPNVRTHITLKVNQD